MNSYAGLLLRQRYMEFRARRRITELLARTFAYIARLHMVRLQAQGVLDDVFFRLIDHMAELDCSREFSGEMGIMLDSFAEFERLARNTAPYLIFVGDDTCYSVPKRFAEELLALQG